MYEIPRFMHEELPERFGKKYEVIVAFYVLRVSKCCGGYV
jgi:hypothetical protein